AEPESGKLSSTGSAEAGNHARFRHQVRSRDMRTLIRNLATSLMVAAGLSLPALSYADDTEIYFAKANAENSENKPVANVLIMMDTSGSMRFCEEEGATSGYNATWCSNHAERRINMLQNAIDGMLEELSPNVRVGLGRFNYKPTVPMPNRGDVGVGQIGGRIIVPVVEVNDTTKSVIRDAMAQLNDAGTNASHPSAHAQPVGDTPTGRAFAEAARYTMGMTPVYGVSANGASNAAVCDNEGTR